ncbi:hypothetical protein CYMTET_30755 [Cymbomonas tetramitiformis]|uniref:Uncharacterized protein n=1 Tax=Cymbomonas tetramitiformis TaxID=36881 RepID=A0AAE0KTK9_9CHLO|nr:hypothetical protein CYMTET_30755 [Cymbomonas tetramitiformis]
MKVEKMEARKKAKVWSGSGSDAERTSEPQWDARTTDQRLKKLVELECISQFWDVKPFVERVKNLNFGDMPVLYDMHSSRTFDHPCDLGTGIPSALKQSGGSPAGAGDGDHDHHLGIEQNKKKGVWEPTQREEHLELEVLAGAPLGASQREELGSEGHAFLAGMDEFGVVLRRCDNHVVVHMLVHFTSREPS